MLELEVCTFGVDGLVIQTIGRKDCFGRPNLKLNLGWKILAIFFFTLCVDFSSFPF